MVENVLPKSSEILQCEVVNSSPMQNIDEPPPALEPRLIHWLCFYTSILLFGVSLVFDGFAIDGLMNAAWIKGPFRLESLDQHDLQLTIEGNRPGRWARSLSLLLTGWVSVCYGNLTWLANPAIAASWFFSLFRSTRVVAIVSAFLALGLSLSFLFYTEIKTCVVPSGSGISRITGYGIGYWLWIASIGTMAIGATVSCSVDLAKNGKPAYSPPATCQSDSPRRSWVCNCMFWLSAILGLVVLAIAVFGGYQHTRFISQNGGRLPPYIVVVTMLIFACGIGLLFSAWQWRSGRIRTGLLSLLGSGVAFFAGPWLLLSLLAR